MPKQSNFQDFELTDEMKQIIEGSLLGDGYLSGNKNNTKASYGIFQKADRKDYVDSIYEKFKPFCLSPPRQFKRYKIDPITGERKLEGISYGFRTRQHKAFSEFFKRFYAFEQKEDGSEKLTKKVPRDLILSDCTLAYWVMDDGAKKGKGLRLHTEGFYIDDVEFLKQKLLELGVKTSIQNQTKMYKNKNESEPRKRSYKILYIWVDSMEDFRNRVWPYMHPLFFYKFNQ